MLRLASLNQFGLYGVYCASVIKLSQGLWSEKRSDKLQIIRNEIGCVISILPSANIYICKYFYFKVSSLDSCLVVQCGS